MAELPELLGEAPDVLVDLVPGPPPMRGHLRYRETLSRHPCSI